LHIIDNYKNEGTALDGAVFRARKAYTKACSEEGVTMFTLSMVISDIQRDFCETIYFSGVSCIKSPLRFKDLHSYNLAIRRTGKNLPVFWGVTQQCFERPELSSQSEDQIRSFMHENTDSLKERTTLSLKGRLTQIPVEINLFVHLKILRITNNSLFIIHHRQFVSLTRLEELTLSGNKLVEVSAALFRGLRQLTHLNLSDNCLRELPEDLLKDQVKLVELNLSNNKLNELPQDLLQLAKLEAVYVDENPLGKDVQTPFIKKGIMTSVSSVWPCAVSFTRNEEKTSQDLKCLLKSLHSVLQELVNTKAELLEIGLLHINTFAWIDDVEEKKQAFAQLENNCLICMKESVTLRELGLMEEKIVSSEKQWKEFKQCFMFLGRVEQEGMQRLEWKGNRTPEERASELKKLAICFDEKLSPNFYQSVVGRYNAIKNLYEQLPRT
jgi:hypothetical protein